MLTLVGQLDSPFVRRVAVALHHHGTPFDRHPLSVYRDFEAVLEINPLGKAPTLLLEDGNALSDSRAILEHLEAGASPERRLTMIGDALPAMLQVEAVGIGLAEKTVERNVEGRRAAPDSAWRERLERQIVSALDWLTARATDDFFVAGRLSRADLAVTVALTFLAHRQPRLYDRRRHAALEAFRARCEALPVFAAVPFPEP